MELETKRFYETAARRSSDTGVRQLRRSSRGGAGMRTRRAIAQTKLSRTKKRKRSGCSCYNHSPGLAGLMDVRLDAGAAVRRRVCDP